MNMYKKKAAATRFCGFHVPQAVLLRFRGYSHADAHVTKAQAAGIGRPDVRRALIDVHICSTGRCAETPQMLAHRCQSPGDGRLAPSWSSVASQGHKMK